MSRNMQLGPDRAVSLEAGATRRPRARFASDSTILVRSMTFSGADQRTARAFGNNRRAGDGAPVTRFASGDDVTDWGAHRSEGQYDAGRNWSFASMTGRMIRYGKAGSWDNPGLVERQFNRFMGLLMATGTAVVRRFGTALKTGFRDVPGAVQRGVDKVMPKGLRTATSVLVSGALLVPALAYGYLKGLWQVCQDIGDGFEGNGLD